MRPTPTRTPSNPGPARATLSRSRHAARLALGLGLTLALSALALGLPRPAAALSLTLSFQSAGQVGSTLDVEVWVAGLGDHVAPSLRGFDIDVAFDDTLLDFTGASFVSSPFLLTSASQSGVGVVDANAVSLASDANIDANEAASFVLVTLSFDVVGTGDALFSLSQLVLTATGTSGSAIASGCSANSCGTLSVPVALPEPGVAWLLALAALPGIRRARASTLSRKERG